MQKQIILPVIEVGAPFIGAFTWTGSATAAQPISSGYRVMGQFRIQPDAAVLTDVDTQDGTLVMSSTTTIQLNMTAAHTELLIPAVKLGWAMIDFRRWDILDQNGAPFRLPFRIRWPVARAITVIP